MAVPLEDGRTIESNLLKTIIGFEPHPKQLRDTLHEMTPRAITTERRIAQAAELLLIRDDATTIDTLLKQKNLRRPVGYAILTAGFQPPEGSILLGKFGSGAFVGFIQPDAVGHEGGVYAIPVNADGDILLAVTGRPHPNELRGERYGDMLAAHLLRTMKELARRQRAEDGRNPVFFLTYLSGATDGHGMIPGDAAIAVSDNEYANMIHPGFGAVGILEKHLGSHFQAKMGRTTHVQLSRMMVRQAGAEGISLYPAAIIGTPGNPEFETDEEIVVFERTVEETKKRTTGEIAKKIFGDKGADLVVPMHVMGVSAELACMRQVLHGEADFVFLPLCLASDAVGGQGSMDVNHEANFAKALAEAPKYMNLMLKIAADAASDPVFQDVTMRDFSLKAKLLSVPD